MTERRAKRGLFGAILVALLLVMAWTMFTSARLETAAWDEVGHLAHGYTYLKTGNFWIDQTNPALPRLMAGLPLLLVNPRLPTEHVSWRTFDLITSRKLFLYHNRVPPDTLMMLGRIPTMLLTLVLGIVLTLWTRRHFGDLAGICALAFYVFNPSIVAHGRYTTTDLHATAGLFFAVIAWGAYLESRRTRYLLLAGLLVGLALAFKHSMVFLFGLFPVLYVIRWWQRREGYSLIRLVAVMVVVVVLATTVVGAVYWRNTAALLRGGGTPMAEHVGQETSVDRFYHQLATKLHLPYHPYLMGFYWVAKTNENLPPSCLFGEVRRGAHWLMTPVALAVKTPTALLIGLLVSIGALIGISIPRDTRPDLRKIPFAWMVLFAPAAIYLAAALTARLNAGIRHLLPLHPFLIAIAAATLGSAIGNPRLARIRQVLLGALAVLLVVESGLAYPHYLAFFNWPSGGSAYGHRYLAASNLDWGQDLKKLKRYLDEKGIDEVYLAYFGLNDPDYYAIPHKRLPTTAEEEQWKNLRGTVAISVNFLKGIFVGPASFEWLKGREPDATVGYSIHIYHLGGAEGK